MVGADLGGLLGFFNHHKFVYNLNKSTIFYSIAPSIFTFHPQMVSSFLLVHNEAICYMLIAFKKTHKYNIEQFIDM
jgi:hypothetical protein